MHLLERNAQQEFDDGSRPFVSNRVRVEMPADTLDEELLRALLDESALSRAMRGVTSNLVEKLSDTLKVWLSRHARGRHTPHFVTALSSEPVGALQLSSRLGPARPV